MLAAGHAAVNVLGLSPDIKSTLSPTAEVLVRFFNGSSREVDLLWINDQGRGVRYAKLGVRQYIDIRTFEGHPWVFRESGTGAPYLGLLGVALEEVQVYWPQRSAAPGIISRAGVRIRPSETSLFNNCVRTIAVSIAANNIDSAAISRLPLPKDILHAIRAYLYRLLRYREEYRDTGSGLVANQLLRSSARNEESPANQVIE